MKRLMLKVLRHLTLHSTQHAGLAENVLDHRLNCRTVYMNPISRFIYWNMNYHLEHHMFPLVPYHALPTLQQLLKDDNPKPHPSIYAAFKDIVPAILRQAKEPTYCITPDIPKSALDSAQDVSSVTLVSNQTPDAEGWLEIGDARLKPLGFRKLRADIPSGFSTLYIIYIAE